MSANDLSAEQQDYQVQLRLLHQQNKRRNNAASGTGSDSTLPDKLFKGRIGNMFLDGELACERCLDKMWKSDANLWGTIQSKVHVPAPEDLKTGPDLQQCFCGWFCMQEDQIKQHYAEHPVDPEVLEGLIQRVERVGMHEGCQDKLVAAMKGA